MNAITLPKNPPTATMGIRTSSSPTRSSPPRSLARSDPLALAVLREQPLGEVHAPSELHQLAPHGLELLVQRRFVFGELGSDIAATGRRALAADPVGHRAADRRERHRDARAAPENEDKSEDILHTRQCGRASRWGSRSFASRRSVKSSRSSASASRRLSSSTSASSRSVSPPSATPCLAAFMAIHCSSVFDHPRIHSASAFPTGPAKTSVAPMTSARPIMPTAGTHSPMRPFPPSRELTDLVAHRQHLAQVLAGERGFHPRHVLRCSRGQYVTARRAPLRPEIDHPVGGLHDVQVVLDHHDRVPLVHQPVQHLAQ